MRDPQPRITDPGQVYFWAYLGTALMLAGYLSADAAGLLTLPLRFGCLALLVVLPYSVIRGGLYAEERKLVRRGSPAGDAGVAEAHALLLPEDGEMAAGRVLFPLFALYFALFLHLLLTLTLLDPAFGRDLIGAENSREYYLKRYLNLKPFSSIWNVYIVNGLGKGHLSPSSVLLNLAGNFVAFMPLSVFLPLFWKVMRRWYVFLPTVTVAVAAVEAMQFLWMRGSCDVDDLILNAGGAAVLYFLLKLPPAERLMNCLTAGLWCAKPVRKTVEISKDD